MCRVGGGSELQTGPVSPEPGGSNSARPNNLALATRKKGEGRCRSWGVAQGKGERRHHRARTPDADLPARQIQCLDNKTGRACRVDSASGPLAGSMLPHSRHLSFDPFLANEPGGPRSAGPTCCPSVPESSVGRQADPSTQPMPQPTHQQPFSPLPVFSLHTETAALAALQLMVVPATVLPWARQNRPDKEKIKCC